MKPSPPEPPVPSPPLTRYEQIAKDVVDALRAMMEEVPKLTAKERRTAAFIRTYIGIPKKFVNTTVNAVEYTPELGQLNQLNLSVAYSTRHLDSAFRPLVTELTRVTEELQLLLDTRQANLAAEALKIYAIAKTLLGRKRHLGPGDLGGPTLAQMKRDLGRRGPRKKRPGAAVAAPARKKGRYPRKSRTVGQRLKRRVER